MFTFSFFVGLTHFLGWKEVCKKSAKRYVFTEFPSVSSRLSLVGKRLSLRRRISRSFQWEVFWSQWNGQAVFNSLLFDFWYHHPLIINVCPPKRYLSFFPKIILPCCEFLSVDFPLFGKTNHFIVCFRFRLPKSHAQETSRLNALYTPACLTIVLRAKAASLATVNGVTPSVSQLIKDWRQEVNSLRRAFLKGGYTL